MNTITRPATRPREGPRAPGPLGQVLLASGAIDRAELEAALGEQRRTGERLGVVLCRRGLDAEQVARALARQLRLGHAAAPLQPEPAALRLLDGVLASRLRVVPLSLSVRSLRVAMADPLDVAAMDDLRFRTGRRIEIMVATPAAIDAALMAAYSDHAVRAVLTKLPGAAVAADGKAAADGARVTEMVDTLALVDLVLAQAVQQRASDIHLEPVDGTMLRVRARVDGVLRELRVLPAQSRGAIVSRIKVMAGLDIAVKRRPQDGRCAVHVQGRELALRVSTLPTHTGEKLVLRLLDSGNARRSSDSSAWQRPCTTRSAGCWCAAMACCWLPGRPVAARQPRCTLRCPRWTGNVTTSSRWRTRWSTGCRA
jgi:type IV pilus assembly protein PilB